VSALLSLALSFHVALADLQRPVAEVELSGLPAGPARLCLDRDGAGAHLSGLPREPDDPDCFRAQGPAARYRVDLEALAQGSHDPDGASRVQGGLVVCDKALLLRPAGAHADAELRISFALPAGASVAAPWQRERGPGLSFRTTLQQRVSGSYLALGELRPLAEVRVPGGSLRPVVLAGERSASDDDLREWLRDAGTAVARLYGGLPGGAVHAVLIPVRGATRPGVFGSLLREHAPSAALFFGARAQGASFHGEWLAFHELFHLGNPVFERRLPWFTEGTATYYQEVLRARAGVRTSAEMWGDLADGLRRYCEPRGPGTLRERLERLRQEHRYSSFYWGGACLFFRLDLSLRKASQGRRTLDLVLRELREQGLRAPLDEPGLLRALSQATAGASDALLDAQQGRDPELDLRALGVENRGDEPAQLHDDAPLAGVRRAMF
jgi:hypothetical protein